MNDDEQQDGKVNIGLSMEQRELLQTKFRALSDTPPSREVWQRIDAQARAEGLFQGRYFETVKWLSGTGIAAAVVLAVLNFPTDSPLSPPIEGSFPDTPDVVVDNSVPSNLNVLQAQSQQIERDLRALPGQPRLVRASTAATIVELEDRIAIIDYRLNHPAVRLSRMETEIYWRERVSLMNSLLNLRRAQAQRMAF
ncbi:MAG: hypothetical protein HOI35_16575 [Woeseia sp.]|jgi:hypothetical protein|nr:hypothetical protein [Woeseia sp.]MBT6211619.1 hypothetical protein [Woeseia sp.]